MEQRPEPDHLTTPALQAWLQRTQTPLDLVALMTIWLTILPFTRATDTSGFTFWVVGRLLLSLLYGIDITVRARLSASPRRYVLSHPIALLAVVVPFVRILFSIRLLSSMFRKGALGHFLFVALMLILNGVILVYFFEVDAAGANIVTLGDSLWWAAVTVATVGYGDYYPVTVGGRLTAVALMAVGLVTAAVITAQIASTFMDQATARRAALAASKTGATGPTAPEVPVVEEALTVVEPEAVHHRLDRIEALLRERLREDGSPSPT
jgi:voltage-gated potassium channel